MHVFLRRLEELSVEADEVMMARILLAASKLKSPEQEQERVETPKKVATLHFPRLRSPERLFDIYQNLEKAHTREERDQALSNLVWLNPPDALSEESFRKLVAGRLFEFELVGALFDYLVVRRRFGEVTDWLKARQSFDSHKSCQRFTQCLIWMAAILPPRQVQTWPAKVLRDSQTDS